MQLFAQIFDLAANICYWSGGEAERFKINKKMKKNKDRLNLHEGNRNEKRKLFHQ